MKPDKKAVKPREVRWDDPMPCHGSSWEDVGVWVIALFLVIVGFALSL